MRKGKPTGQTQLGLQLCDLKLDFMGLRTRQATVGKKLLIGKTYPIFTLTHDLVILFCTHSLGHCL